MQSQTVDPLYCKSNINLRVFLLAGNRWVQFHWDSFMLHFLRVCEMALQALHYSENRHIKKTSSWWKIQNFVAFLSFKNGCIRSMSTNGFAAASRLAAPAAGLTACWLCFHDDPGSSFWLVCLYYCLLKAITVNCWQSYFVLESVSITLNILKWKSNFSVSVAVWGTLSSPAAFAHILCMWFTFCMFLCFHLCLNCF